LLTVHSIKGDSKLRFKVSNRGPGFQLALQMGLRM